MADKKDGAGKLLGWSLGTGVDKKSHSELIKVPCIYSFKVIGDASRDFQNELVETIQRKMGRKINPGNIESKKSSQGKYLSLTFRIRVETLQEIYEIYALLKAHPSTKTVL